MIVYLLFPFSIATGQIETLKLMVAFAKDFCLSNVQNQQRARKKALALWQIPEKIPIPAYGKTCDTACALMLEELPLSKFDKLGE